MRDLGSAISGILAKYRDRSSNYGEALFDHLPMTVAALAEMGAGETHVAAWAERYAARHALRPASHAELAGRVRWRARIRDVGRSQAISERAAFLTRGIGAAAFHAAIRAAYAVERGDDDELAAALEAWEREYLSLSVAPSPRNVSLESALAELALEPVDAGERGLIATRMATVAKHPRFAAVAAVSPSTNDIDGLALAAAAAFALSGNFTALHVMTGTHAMRVLLPHLGAEKSTMHGFWCAYAAAALVAGTVPTLEPNVLAELRAAAPQSWDSLLAQAIAQDDEHVMKATYTAWRLDRQLHDGVYRTAAQHYLAVTGANRSAG